MIEDNRIKEEKNSFLFKISIFGLSYYFKKYRKYVRFCFS